MNDTVTPPISQGWYVPTIAASRLPRPRWVLAIGNGYVYYSRGGDRKLECQEQTMRRWITRFKAECHTEKP